jgi:hypothetical protein
VLGVLAFHRDEVEATRVAEGVDGEVHQPLAASN